MTVINPKTGREFVWRRNKWTPRTRARWHKKTIYGGPVIGSVRAIAHLDWMDKEAKRIFGPSFGVEVIQSAYNDTVKASAGTHNEDLVFDLYIPGVGWWRQQRFFRNHGFWDWYRHLPLFSNHNHGICMVPRVAGKTWSESIAARGFKVGVYIDGGYSLYGRRVASSQVEAYEQKSFGLVGQQTPGMDHSYYPPNLGATIFNLPKYIQNRKRIQARSAA